MNAEFYQGNRQRLYDSLPDHTLLLLFSGSSIRKTADENYPFYADRSFLYLTGIGQEHTVLMAEKDGEEVQETLYILPPDMLAEPVEFFSVDVSFISLHHIFPVAQAITTPDAMGVCLVKPQFEAGREKVGKNGVVRDPATHREVLHNAMGYAAANGFAVRGLDFSPVKGPEGNIEYLMFVQKSEEPCVLDDAAAEQVVAASHSTLDR